MTKLLIGSLAVLALSGCDQHSSKTGIKFSLTPESATHRILASCIESSSNACHFALSGPVSPVEASVKVGDTFTFHGDPSGVLYCAEPSRPVLGNCSATSMAFKRQVISKKTSTDEVQ